MPKSLLSLLFVLCCSMIVLAQKEHPDLIRLKTLQKTDLNAARNEANKMLERIPNRSGEYYHHIRINLASTLWKLNNCDSAEIVINETPTSKLPTEKLKVEQLICSADILDMSGKNDEAISIYLKALSLAKKHNFKRDVATIHNNLGSVYLVREDYPNARRNFNQALSIRKSLNDSVETAMIYGNLGSYYRRVRDIDSARVFYYKCIRIREQLNDVNGLNSIYMSVAILDQLEGKRADAIKTYQRIIERADSIKNYEIVILGNINMANAYYYSGKYVLAEKTCLKALQLSEDYDDDRNLAVIYKLLSYIYEKKGDASKVLEYSKLYHDRYSEIFNIEKEKEVNRLQIKFDSQEKDHQIGQLERKQIEADLIAKEKELATRNTLFWVYLSVIILGLSLAFILIIYFRKRKFSRRQNQLLEEREILLKEVHHRVKNNLQIVSSLLNLQGELSENLNPQEVLIQSQNRIQSIAIIHEKLYQSSSLADVKLDAYIQELIDYLCDSYDLHAKGIEIKCAVDSISIHLDQIVPCGLIINELITNSIKHAFVNGGSITINGSLQDGKITLDLIDNGKGFPENFELSTSNSLGLKLAKGLARQLKGTLEIIEGSGAHFRLTIKQ